MIQVCCFVNEISFDNISEQIVAIKLYNLIGFEIKNNPGTVSCFFFN